MNQKQAIEILETLKSTYPDAKCSLDFATPFELLVAVILSAQCTDEMVNKTTPDIFKNYKTPEDFANMDLELLEQLVHPCGFYKNKAKNIKATAKILATKYNSKVPSTMEELLLLPGVGRKTANVVLANAFGEQRIAVDTHVFRVSNRIGLVNEDNVLDTENALMKKLPKDTWSLAHHLLIFHGRRVCKAQRPLCELCNLSDICLYRKGIDK